MEQFHKACKNIVKNKEAKALNYAVDYTKYGLTITDKYEATTQALYILNNISYWRGKTAKETRQMLKDFVNHNSKSN